MLIKTNDYKNGHFKVSLTVSKYRSFEYTMIIVIILNSLSLAFYDYKDRNSQTQWNKDID